MGIEGLDYILNKQEVIPTVSASDLVHYAERVEDDYRRHVRTYVPINRAAEGREGMLSVEAFERKLIKAVKEGKAPRGYLTAEYGYGKTSTALYLWQRAENENLLVVPPFQMLHLADLVTATHGWVRYRLSIHNPGFVPQLDDLYQATVDRSLETEARKSNTSVSQLQQWVEQGKFNLDLQPADFIQYFEKVTEIVLQAGFAGLLVLADEVQQYIEPSVKKSADPIAPLFNLVQMLLTRENRLCFGLIFIIGLKEVGLIRELRNDLLHRMRDISLDLTNVYDYEFASRLWHLLAKEFDFRDVSNDITTPEALEALGEIASRTDLSDGPRTVINTFRRMVERFKTYGVSVGPYTPIDLVDDMLTGAIQFTGNNQIQNVTQRALQTDIVRNDPERFERAIKLAAAYPASGVPFRTQQKFRVDEPLEELMRLAIGEIVISIGLPENRGMTLFGLHSGIQKTDWLSQTIRDFRRGYGEHHESTRRRARTMFSRIIKEIVFKNWSVVEERPSTFTSDQSIVLQGDFQSFSTRYPRRQVHVRILWDDEERKDAHINGDIAIEYYLTLRPDLQGDPDERRRASRPLIVDYGAYTVMMEINLLHVREEGVPQQIQSQLEGVWSPYDLSPLVLMNIYEMLEEKRGDKLIPPMDDQFIKNGFQPELALTIVRDLFNAGIGEPFGGVSQGRITETAVETLLDNRYRDIYSTIMAQSQWRSSLNKYANAIAQLSNIYQKRGEVEVEGSKDEIAKLLAFSNTGLDSFVRTFSAFIEVTRSWSGGSQGAVRFSLHDLEQRIVHWLKSANRTQKVPIGGKTFDVHVLNLSEVYDQARLLGYQDEETEALLGLLERREMIEFYQNYLIREVPSQTIDLDNVAIQIREFSRELEDLLKGFPENSLLVGMRNQSETWQSALEKERQTGTPDPQRVHNLSRNIQFRETELRKFAQDKQRDVANQIGMLRRNLRPINPQHLNVLNNLFEGGVNYVDQVNVLRTHLQRHALSIKSRVDRANMKIEELERAIQQPDLLYAGLANCALSVTQVDSELHGVSSAVNEFDILYRHLTDWQRLLKDGSELSYLMQQMGHLALEFQEKFEYLCRDIMADVSSTGDKLDALPNHSLYSATLGNLLQDVRRVRQVAEEAFIQLQNRYYQEFTNHGLYPRDRIGQPFEYNLSNPQESYRLLHSRVQDLASGLCSQLRRVITDRRHEIQGVLSTPLISELPDEDRIEIQQKGNSLLSTAEECLQQLQYLDNQIQDITVIRDFSIEGAGQFTDLMAGLIGAYTYSRELAEGSRRLSEWLTEIKLSSEEEYLLAHLPSENTSREPDLVEWLEVANIDANEFWSVLRGLHEKHRIRLLVARMRNERNP